MHQLQRANKKERGGEEAKRAAGKRASFVRGQTSHAQESKKVSISNDEQHETLANQSRQGRSNQGPHRNILERHT